MTDRRKLSISMHLPLIQMKMCFSSSNLMGLCLKHFSATDWWRYTHRRVCRKSNKNANIKYSDRKRMMCTVVYYSLLLLLLLVCSAKQHEHSRALLALFNDVKRCERTRAHFIFPIHKHEYGTNSCGNEIGRVRRLGNTVCLWMLGNTLLWHSERSESDSKCQNIHTISMHTQAVWHGERRAFLILLFCHFIRTFGIQCWLPLYSIPNSENTNVFLIVMHVSIGFLYGSIAFIFAPS